MPPIPESLINAVRDRSLIPFVGAGLSVGVGCDFPSWAELIKRFAKRLREEGMDAAAAEVDRLLDLNEYTAAAESAVENLTKPRFIQEMQAAFDKQRPRQADLSAVEALWRLAPRLVITTNYESVLEWTYERKEELIKIHNDDPALLNEIDQPSRSKVPMIWHLHGSIKRPDTLILTESQYKRLYGSEGEQIRQYRYALTKLQVLMAQRPLLFVGFSLKDPFVKQQIRKVLALTSHNSPVSFMLVHQSEKEAAKLVEHVQAVTFEDFGPPLVALLNEIAESAWGALFPAIELDNLGAEIKALIEELLPITRGLVLSPVEVSTAYNNHKPPAWPYFPLYGDGVKLLSQAISEIAGAVRQGENGPFPVIEFVREISAKSPQPFRGRLEDWLENAIRKLARDQQDVQRLRAGFGDTSGQADEAYVLVRISEDTASPGNRRAQAWLFGEQQVQKIFGDERLFSGNDFSELLDELLFCLEQREVNPQKTTLAFLLPRSLMVESVDQWRPPVAMDIPEPPIGASHNVVVRSLDRVMQKRVGLRLRERWNEWKIHADGPLAVVGLDQLDAAAQFAAVWLETGQTGGTTFVERLYRKKVLCAIMANAPPGVPEEPNRDLFNSLLKAGIPVILWLRKPLSSNPAEVRAMVQQLIEHDAAKLLPQRVLEKRREASESEGGDHFGACLTLLWDDWEHLPPDENPANRASVVRA
jgi:hypothetical protein